MKQALSCLLAVSLAVSLGPLPIYAQDTSNFQEPDTGALKPMKTAAQAAQDAEKPKKEEEKPPSAPLNASTGSAKQTVSQMSNGPEVAWVYHSRTDAPKSLFARSIAERMQAGSLRGAVSNPPSVNNSPASSQAGTAGDAGPPAVTSTSVAVTAAEPSLTDTVGTSSPSVSTDLGTPASSPAAGSGPSVSVSSTSPTPAPGLVTRPTNAHTAEKPASQPALTSPINGLDQKTLDLLPAVIFAATVNGGGQTGTSALAGPAAMPVLPKEAAVVKPETGPQGVRAEGAREEAVRRMGQRGTAMEKLAGTPSKGGAGKSGLLSDGQSSQTGWFDTLRDRVNRNNVSDMKEREGESEQMCMSFADTDGIAKMIEKSSEQAGLSEDHPRILYAYGQDPGNIVFITVVQLDEAGQPKKAARLFADGRVQAFGQLAKQDILGKVFEGEPVPPKEVLFTKTTYRITGILTSETISQFFLDQSRGAARGPCPKPFSKK